MTGTSELIGAVITKVEYGKLFTNEIQEIEVLTKDGKTLWLDSQDESSFLEIHTVPS